MDPLNPELSAASPGIKRDSPDQRSTLDAHAPSRPILLIEDNLAHAELVRRSFEDHLIPNDLYHVSDGKAALDYLFREGSYADGAPPPRPHVILLDLRLPKVSGLEVLRRVKEAPELCNIPIVVLTTSASATDIETAYAHNANGYVTKPVDFVQFTRLIEALGHYWLEWNHPPNKTAA